MQTQIRNVLGMFLTAFLFAVAFLLTGFLEMSGTVSMLVIMFGSFIIYAIALLMMKLMAEALDSDLLRGLVKIFSFNLGGRN